MLRFLADENFNGDIVRGLLLRRPDLGANARCVCLGDRFPVGRAIEETLLVVECSEAPDWQGRAVHLPLNHT
ncbi:MAG: hypothetical protein U0793_16505 [Gemmataceae bacterium]